MCRYFRKLTRCKVMKSHLKSPLLLMPSLFLFAFLTSCYYHAPAIKGLPVKELIEERKLKVVRKEIMTEEKRKRLLGMSKVTENQVFTEVSGIPEYKIGPGDVLEIKAHIGDRVETTTVTVNSLGRISYSFVDDLYVAGMTPSQLDEALTRELSSYIRKPRIEVMVKEYKSKSAMIIGFLTSLQATTVGKAASGRVYLKGKTTLVDVIALAGGYTVDADIRRVKLTRGGETYIINLYDIISRGDQTQNVIIDAGDVVTVPELPTFGDRVYVLGEVVRQGIYPLKQAQDLLGALSLAGSFTDAAKEENTLIIRGYRPGTEPLVMMADVNAILRDADIVQNIPLQDGDLVYVPPRRIGDVNRWIRNTLPLLDILLWPGDFAEKYSTGYKVDIQ
ncbi:MAG: polysaccharide biosynthesis/export family protein [Deltaproteobacteria bacterium]|nr:polysaccharide biosynthesis/export family protein [Deltaproteobacteria bacterium]